MLGPKIRLTLLAIYSRRIALLLKGFMKVIELKLPWRTATFPLLTKMGCGTLGLNEVQDCASNQHPTVDVVLSLYKFERYEPIIRESVKSCLNNPKITFFFVLVRPSQAEILKIQFLLSGTKHKLLRVDTRLGIYSAWNLAIQQGTGDFITNLNADDLRLPHAICRHAAFLVGVDADGSYGDFALTHNHPLTNYPPEDRVILSSLGPFDLETLIYESQNFMHCAPMWKRELHDRFGMFDGALVSSGDTEFWLRCLAAGASFEHFPSPTVIYFYNPQGLSSSFSSTGRLEWARIRKDYLKRKFDTAVAK